MAMAFCTDYFVNLGAVTRRWLRPWEAMRFAVVSAGEKRGTLRKFGVLATKTLESLGSGCFIAKWDSNFLPADSIVRKGWLHGASLRWARAYKCLRVIHRPLSRSYDSQGARFPRACCSLCCAPQPKDRCMSIMWVHGPRCRAFGNASK